MDWLSMVHFCTSGDTVGGVLIVGLFFRSNPKVGFDGDMGYGAPMAAGLAQLPGYNQACCSLQGGY